MIKWKNEKENLRKYLESGKTYAEIGREYYNGATSKTISNVVKRLGLETSYNTKPDSIEILEKYKERISVYINNGLTIKMIIDKLNLKISDTTFRRRIKNLGIVRKVFPKTGRHPSTSSEEDLINSVKSSKSYSEVCRKLGLVDVGGNLKTVRRKIENLNLDTSHFTGQLWNKGGRSKAAIPLKNLLKPNTRYSTKLKDRILDEGIKERQCECCGNTEHMGKPIPLQLHHIDGDRSNNQISNIQILCPNCHSLTDNFCKSKSSLIIPMPSKDDFLSKLKESKTLKELALTYNISTSLLRTWIKRLNLRNSVELILKNKTKDLS